MESCQSLKRLKDKKKKKCTVHLLLFLNITNKCTINIITVCIITACVNYTPTCFVIPSCHQTQTVYNQYLAKLHAFFKLQLLEIHSFI
jgi:hypothetical protein